MKEQCLLKEFKQNQYPNMRKDLLEKSIELFAFDVENIKERFLNDLRSFINEISNENIGKVKQINISVPYINICADSPTYIFEVYQDIPFVSEVLLSKEYAISWNMIKWSEQVNQLVECVKQTEMNVHLKRHSIEAMHRKSLKRYLLLIAAFMKVLIKDLDTQLFFEELEKDMEFKITLGEYYDWQDIIFKKRTIKQISSEDKNKDYSYGEWKNKDFSNEKFQKLDLSNSVFYKCSFKNCVFDSIVFCDSEFDKCIYDDCSFSDITLYGVNIQNSKFKDIYAKNIKTDPYKESYKNFGIYDKFHIMNSSLQHIICEDSDMSFANFKDNRITDIRYKNTEIEK